MIAEENADGKWSEKKMEKKDGLRTVECLRGRLIAERAASRKAKEDAELMGNKSSGRSHDIDTHPPPTPISEPLVVADPDPPHYPKRTLRSTQLIELEIKLRVETRSRNKAEKKLKYFMKKLESMNISYVSDESEQSNLLDKSEISSVTSTTTSINTKISENKEQNSQFKGSVGSEFQDSIGSTKCSSENSINLEQNALHMTIFSKDYDSHSGGEENVGKSSEFEFTTSDANSSKSLSQEEGENGEDERDLQKDDVNNSLALVYVDFPKPEERIDPIVLDATVREVLDALRHAKEKLQTRMERGRTIKVG